MRQLSAQTVYQHNLLNMTDDYMSDLPGVRSQAPRQQSSQGLRSDSHNKSVKSVYISTPVAELYQDSYSTTWVDSSQKNQLKLKYMQSYIGLPKSKKDITLIAHHFAKKTHERNVNKGLNFRKFYVFPEKCIALKCEYQTSGCNCQKSMANAMVP